MKTQKIRLYAVLVICLVCFSFGDSNFLHLSNETEKLANEEGETTLEEKKAVLVAYYSNLIEQEVDRRFSESEDGRINESDLISSLVLPEYGCAYSGSGCSGRSVCGVSMLYASTFGYSSWSGESSGNCQQVAHQ